LKNLDAYKLKWIAIVAMVVAHVPYIFWDVLPMPLNLILGIIGGLTFPIMAYFVTEGYRHTSNIKKYLLRLLIFGIIATPFHMIVINFPTLNIMFTIILSLLVLMVYDRLKSRVLFWVLFAVIVAPLSFMYFKHYAFGVLMVVLFHAIKDEKKRRVIPPTIAGVCWILLGLFGVWGIRLQQAFYGAEVWEQMLLDSGGGIVRSYDLMMSAEFMMAAAGMGVFFIIAGFLLSQYNGERGKKSKWSKWLFYVAYPLHFAVLIVIAWFMGLV